MLLLFPVCFEFGWRQIAERRVDPFVLIHVLDELADLGVCVGEIMVIRQVHLFFLDGADEPRRREKKKRKAVRGERDWDREGGGVGARKEKRRSQNYLDYEDLDDDLDKDDLAADDMIKDDLDKDDGASST